MIDLHVHTHYSDGKYSPLEQLQEAARLGLSALAFTDHDNANGYRQGLAFAAELGIELVPAVELTTAWPGLDLLPGAQDIDLLGYFVQVDSSAFQELERFAYADLCARLELFCERLAESGCRLSLEEIRAVNRRFPSLVSAVVALLDKKMAADWSAAVRLVNSAWHRVRPSALEIGQAIRAVHAAGGLAVLAHPAEIACRAGLLPPARIHQLVELGLDGIEVYHYRNDELARAYFLKQVRRNNLLVTGGSDDHGWKDRHLGSQPVPPALLEDLRARLDGRIPH